MTGDKIELVIDSFDLRKLQRDNDLLLFILSMDNREQLLTLPTQMRAIYFHRLILTEML